MPLSPNVDRDPIHTRAIECKSYRRSDGLWDIEGHLTDVKAYPFLNDFRGEVKAGEPLHDMWIRLTVDREFINQQSRQQGSTACNVDQAHCNNF